MKRWANPSMLITALIVATCVMSACASSTPAGPSGRAVVTLTVGGESFRVSLTDAEQVAAARAAQGSGPARIPNGRIVTGMDVNTGWSWHLEDLVFVEAAIELCDGRPSDVEREGISFGGGRFCPWSATIVQIVSN